MIDSYHDRRTGFIFAVNPQGVQRDLYMYNDGVEDLSWDGVWDVKTVVDSLGWIAGPCCAGHRQAWYRSSVKSRGSHRFPRRADSKSDRTRLNETIPKPRAARSIARSSMQPASM